jgi:DNA polymerase-3 subunit beta
MEVEVTAKKNNVVIIETPTCQFKIIGLPHEEFPKLPEFKDKEAITIDQAMLKYMIALTAFAVSLGETRYILNGILFRISKDTVSLVATDGKRLAICTKKLSRPAAKEISIIVPIKTIHELQRNLTDTGEVSLTVGSNQVLFDVNGTSVISRLIEGEFPDYQQVIPAQADSKIKVNREQFLLAIRRAALLSTPDYQAVKFEVFKNKLVLSKSTPDVGESREELNMEYSGKEMIIGFNPNYLSDVLKNLATENVELEITGSEKPGVVRAEGYVYIVLPMRLG